MNKDESSPLTARLLDEQQDSTKEEVVTEESEKKDRAEVTALSSLAVPTGETPWERGEKQPSKFRDWPFGALFHMQFVTVVTLGSIYTNNFLQLQKQSNQDDLPTNTINLGFIIPALVSAGTSLLLILVALVVLTRMGKTFITCSVWTSAIISFMIGITALSANLVPLGVLSLISALIGCCYAYAVRNRIPFAAANLNAGVSSIKSNGGITCVVLLIGLMLFMWMMLWTVSLIGVLDIQQVCNQQGDGNYDDCDLQVSHPGYVVLWVFFLFWTQQVFKNIIHATVAGLVGTWYFDPQDAASFCSSALGTSLYRSVTYSFGSICFGSLCVAILQTLDYIVQSLRNQREREGEQNPGMALLLCCLDCILSIMAGIMEFFNKWAFIYVGVYGYDFLTAGKKVMTLFKERGWTVVINDNLINNALGLMCFVIALLSSISIALLGEDFRTPAYYVLGFTVGLFLSMTIMSIIDSAVSTIIVCFAEAPEEFNRNHSSHCRDMVEAWVKVYNISF